MQVPAVIRRYLEAMEKGDFDLVCDCFAPDAVVVSPVYGAAAAEVFYAQLFADTIRTGVRLRNLYAAEGRSDRVIAHFDYAWERRGQLLVETRLIDLFDLDPPGQKIARLRIIVDSGPE